MRHLKWFGMLLIVISISYGKNANAQENKDCKVLQKELSGEYKGDCKKGLADGVGEAIGTDRYSGSFKKGYAHGKGIYNYSSGAVYEGGFLNGKRHGQGKLIYQNEGEDN